MSKWKIYNEDCKKTMEKMQDNSVDIILTSPPYNTGRPSTSEKSREDHSGRYDVYLDTKTPDEFCDWCVLLFDEFNRILKKDGVVLWNMSYGNDSTVNTNGLGLLWILIGKLIERTDFTIADRIIWKKYNALPDNVSRNKLTRICEDVFVFVRKNELNTFYTNKRESGTSRSGQTFYSPIYNFIEAKNNDESCPLNKATYSSELCVKLLNIYARQEKGVVVYDPFMGTGTTAVACKRLGIDCIGSEISEKQCEWAEDRLNEMSKNISLFDD